MKKNIKKIIVLLTALICGVFSAGCGAKKKNTYKESTTKYMESTTEYMESITIQEEETIEEGTDYVGTRYDLPEGVTAKSSDESVIKIANGKVMCIGEGTSVFMVTNVVTGKTEKRRLTIKEMEITDFGTDYVGNSTNVPDNCTAESSDESVIKIANGKIICVGEGKCIVTIYNAEGSVIKKIGGIVKEKEITKQQPKSGQKEASGQVKVNILSVGRSHTGSAYIKTVYTLKNEMGYNINCKIEVSLLDKDGNVLTTENAYEYDLEAGTTREKSTLIRWSGDYADVKVNVLGAEF